MKRSFLAAMGLTEEQIDSIMSEHGKTVSTVKDEVSDLKEEIDKRDTTIKDLQKDSGNSEDLQEKLRKAQADNEEWQKKYAASQKTATVKLAVAKEAHDAEDIVRFVDIDKLNVKDDGTIEGLDAEISRLKEAKPYLFIPADSGTDGEGDDQGDDQNQQGDQQRGTQQNSYIPPGGNKRGNGKKDEDPAELARLDIERRHGKKKEA